jgi:hypothetical protein
MMMNIRSSILDPQYHLWTVPLDDIAGLSNSNLVP